MKAAVQTIAWGSRPESIAKVLREARVAGYDGVEMFQHPSQLLRDGSAHSFYDQLANENSLVLVGLTGGSITERVEFVQLFEMEQTMRLEACARTGKRPPLLATQRP